MDKNTTQKNQQNYQCQYEGCNKQFKYQSHYQRHVLTHEKSKIFVCKQCDKKFKRSDALIVHERTHNEDFRYECKFEGCDEKFTNKAGLRYHELKHKNNNTYKCEHEGCNKCFLTIGQLKQHQRTKKHNYLVNTTQNKQLEQKSKEKVDKKIIEQESQLQQEIMDIIKTDDNKSSSDDEFLLKNSVDKNSSSYLSNILELSSDPLINFFEPEQQLQKQKKQEQQLQEQKNEQENIIKKQKREEQINNNKNELFEEIKTEQDISQQQQQNENLNCIKPEICYGKDIFDFDQYEQMVIDNLWEKKLLYNDLDEPESQFGRFRLELKTIVGLVGKIQEEQQDNNEKIKTALSYMNFANEKQFEYNNTYDLYSNINNASVFSGSQNPEMINFDHMYNDVLVNNNSNNCSSNNNNNEQNFYDPIFKSQEEMNNKQNLFTLRNDSFSRNLFRENDGIFHNSIKQLSYENVSMFQQNSHF